MPHPSIDLKQTAVLHYLNISHNLIETSQIFHCSIASFYRWVLRYTQTNSLLRLHPPSCSYKIRQIHVDEALHYLSSHQTVSIPELHAYLQNKFDDFSITDDHLRRVVRDNNLTRKRTRHGHYPKVRHKNPTNRKTDLKAFYAVVSSFPMDKIISIDETSLTPFMFRRGTEIPTGRSISGGLLRRQSYNEKDQSISNERSVQSVGLHRHPRPKIYTKIRFHFKCRTV